MYILFIYILILTDFSIIFTWLKINNKLLQLKSITFKMHSLLNISNLTKVYKNIKYLNKVNRLKIIYYSFVKRFIFLN